MIQKYLKKIEGLIRRKGFGIAFNMTKIFSKKKKTIDTRL